MFGLDNLSKERREELTAVVGLVAAVVLVTVGFQIQAYKAGTSTQLHAPEFQASVIQSLSN